MNETDRRIRNGCAAFLLAALPVLGYSAAAVYTDAVPPAPWSALAQAEK